MKIFKNNMLKNIFLVALTGLIFCSCAKLEETPKSIIAPENFYATVPQCEAAFAASLAPIWKAWTNYEYAGFFAFKNDDQQRVGDLNITTDWGKDLWNGHYECITNINGVLKAVKEGRLKASQSDIDKIQGQGAFLRAHNYFMLVREFGGVPIYNTDNEPGTSNKIPRSTIAETYNQIVSDLTDAAAKLPAVWPDKQKAKPTKGAAMGLLAKVYLTMATSPLNETANYVKAAAAAKSVIDDGAHSLVPNIFDVFKYENKFTTEMMFAYQSDKVHFGTHSEVWLSGNVLGGWGDFQVEPTFETTWKDQPRKKAYLITEANGIPYTSTTWGYPNCPINQKFVVPNISPDDLNRGSSANMPILRFADVLLIYAEAENAVNGPTQAACDAVNKVINRANGYVANADHPLLTITMSKADFEKAVLQERNWELCFEYDRYFDILRKKLLLIVNQNDPNAVVNFSENDYLWPIPIYDIKLNPLLNQNPGY